MADPKQATDLILIIDRVRLAALIAFAKFGMIAGGKMR